MCLPERINLCRGICIRKDRSLPQLPNHIHMRGVRLLVVEHPIDSSWCLASGISGYLVWLRWRNCPFISLPRTISLRNLRVLELQYPKEDIEKFFDSIDEVSNSKFLGVFCHTFTLDHVVSSSWFTDYVHPS